MLNIMKKKESPALRADPAAASRGTGAIAGVIKSGRRGGGGADESTSGPEIAIILSW